MAWWHQTDGPDDYRIRELLRGDLHALWPAHWLWRGQPNYTHDLTAGIRTREAAGGLPQRKCVVESRLT